MTKLIISIDNRHQNTNRDSIIEGANLNQALKYLGMLDGVQHTLFSAQCKDKTLMIGGGDKAFVVTLDDDNGSKTLLNPIHDKYKMIELCAGGQYAEYPVSLVVEKSDAANALKCFYTNSQESLDWLIA